MPQNGVYDLLKMLEIALDEGYSVLKYTVVNKREIETLIDRIYQALPTEVQEAHQGAGYGETLLQEYILSKSYEQEFWEDDPRYRETKNQTFNTDVDRTAKYKVLNILHSVPRKSNPSGTFDNDQYLIRILFKSTFDYSALITWLNTYLASANSGVQVETTGY